MLLPAFGEAALAGVGMRPLLQVSPSLASAARLASPMAFVLDADQALGTVRELSTVAGTTGAKGVLVFAAAHTAAIVLCFPATIAFELAAGYIFGLWAGIGLVWAVKVIAACLTFGLSRALSPLLARLGATEAAQRAFAEQPRLNAMADSVQQQGLRFTVLARLSPVPSYINNFGLALLGVDFAEYAKGTVLATLPAVALHVSSGAGAASLVAATAVGGAAASPGFDAVLGGLGVVGSALLLQQLIQGAARPDADEDETLR